MDPGLYTAVVLLSLKGEVVAKEVRRDWSERDVVEFITTYGRPILFAVDVAHVPSFVEKLAARFRAPIFTPPRDLTKEEKARMAPYIRDNHLRDAYAAALKAYRKYANRFRSIDRRASSEEEAEAAKEAVVRGQMAFSPPPEPPTTPKEESPPKGSGERKPHPTTPSKEEVLRRAMLFYKEKLKERERELQELRKALSEARRRIGALKRALARCSSKHKRPIRDGKKGR